MPDLSGGWRHPGWSWAARHARLTAAGYWVATLLAGGALGGVLSMVPGSWKAGLVWTCAGLTVAAALCFAFSEVTRRGVDRMRRRHGTAYIVYEDARFWTPQEVTRFWQGIRRQFADVVQVPGPREIAGGWDWSLDATARDWDDKTDELVHAFRVLGRDKLHRGITTPDSVFIWAWWAVAFAFGMRVTAADRGLDLDVWQRPSRAREADVYPEIWAQRPHRFGPAMPGAGLPHEASEHVWKADLDVTRWGRARPGANSAHITVLLVRFSGSEWGPVPEVAAAVANNQLPGLKLYDAARVAPTAPSQAEVHELRCVPPAEGFAWEAYPALAAKAIEWISEKAGELAGRTLLLGTLMPQEMGLAIGILAGQPGRRSRWPAHLWPIVAEPVRHHLVVPNLDLGSASVDPALADGRGA